MKEKDSPLAIVMAELRAADIKFRVVRKRHAKVWFMWDGKPQCYVCTVNGKNGNRAQRNTRAGIRRMLRQLGAVDASKKRG